MTENEAIEVIKTEKECVTRNTNNNCDRDCINCDLLMSDEEIFSGYDMAIQALEEIQQYRAIGTVDELKRAKAMENVYGQIKWERDVAISQLEEIGVGLGQKMEELKALKEKSTPKKLTVTTMTKYHHLHAQCPVCECGVSSRWSYCQGCGQKLDWSEPFKRLECE